MTPINYTTEQLAELNARNDERRRNEASRQLAALCSLINTADKLKAFLVKRADTGRLYSDEDHLRLSMLESLSGLFDSDRSIDEHIDALRDDLGLEEDESDGWEDEADYRYDEMRERAA